MEKEDIQTIAQILNAIDDSVEKLERAEREKNLEEFSKSKKEILKFQKKIAEIL